MTKKRLIAIILALILVLSLIVGVLPAASAAEAYTIGLKDSSGKSGTTVNPGATVVLQLTLANNPGIISAGASITYPAGLTLTKVEEKAADASFTPKFTYSPSLSSNPYLVWMMAATGTKSKKLVTYNGSICQLTFRVSDTADNGDYKITVSAPGDKNLTANTDGSGVIVPGTNKKVSGVAVSDFTVQVYTTECKAHNFVNYTVTTPATCTANAKESAACENGCGTRDVREVAGSAVGHNLESVSGVAATCTTGGTKAHYQCKTCGVLFADSEGKTAITKDQTAVGALGHNFQDPTVSKKPTCTEKGLKSGNCTRCNQKTTEEIPAIGHKFANPTITKKPTCVAAGVQSGKCENCGKNTTQAIPATGHKFGEVAVTKEATCLEKGTKTQTCELCQETVTEEQPALGHDFGETTVYREASIHTPGIVRSKCIRCTETQETTTPCREEDISTGIVLETEEGVFPKDTQMRITFRVPETESYQTVRDALAEISGKFVAYDIATVLNGQTVQPDGTVRVSFRIPTDFSKNVALYYFTEDGKLEKLPVVVQEENALTVEVSHLGSYVLCDMNVSPSYSFADWVKDNREVLSVIALCLALLTSVAIVFVIWRIRKA